MITDKKARPLQNHTGLLCEKFTVRQSHADAGNGDLRLTL